MDKREKQVRKASECEECKERDKMVDDVIRKIGESEPKKRSLFYFFKSIDQFNHSEITVKIEITWLRICSVYKSRMEEARTAAIT